MRAPVVRTSRSTQRLPAIQQGPVETVVQLPTLVTVHELEDVPGQLIVSPLEVRRASE